MKREILITYVFISQFSTKIYAVDFRLFLKNCYKLFSGYFFKNSFEKKLLAYFYVVAEVDDFGRIYTSLVAQR